MQAGMELIEVDAAFSSNTRGNLDVPGEKIGCTDSPVNLHPASDEHGFGRHHVTA